jgi:hypothetical protein
MNHNFPIVLFYSRRKESKQRQLRKTSKYSKKKLNRNFKAMNMKPSFPPALVS